MGKEFLRGALTTDRLEPLFEGVFSYINVLFFSIETGG
jgi:hypothetical protein